MFSDRGFLNKSINNFMVIIIHVWITTLFFPPQLWRIIPETDLWLARNISWVAAHLYVRCCNYKKALELRVKFILTPFLSSEKV